ncbi:addiction module protein [Rhodoferax sp.]|uniref:addiction module protein n=1 Tax=Rhodoferax sp. TaxID=50421 RepID=UPI0027716987|nr:addiction module protein [Rhodoferax sp.]
MNAAVNVLRAQAEALPPSERAELIEALMESLDHSDKVIEALWASEAEDRLAALERGEIIALDEPQALRAYRARKA